MAGTDGTTCQTGELHALADLLADLTPGALPVDHLDQLEALERIKSAAAAAQAVVAATFADATDGEDVPASGRRTPTRALSIGAEVALATLSSPYAGEQRVLLSRRLRDHLPLTLAALRRGELTEDRRSPSHARSSTSLPSSARASTRTSRRGWPASATFGSATRCVGHA